MITELKACLAHDGPHIEQENLKRKVCKWATKQRKTKTAVSSIAVIDGLLALESSFIEKDPV